MIIRMMPERGKASEGFSLTELFFLLGGVFLLGFIFLPYLAKARLPAHKLNCVTHLKTVSLAARIFATDNDDLLPGLVFVTNQTGLDEFKLPEFYRTLSNEMSSPGFLLCPADTSRRASRSWTNLSSTNISFFANLDADESRPEMMMFGDRNLTVNNQKVPPGLLLVTTNLNLGWSKEIHGSIGNIAMADGSVQRVSNGWWRAVLEKHGSGTNRVLVP